MIPPDVSVFFPPGMQRFYCLTGNNKFGQNLGQVLVKICLMVQIEFVYPLIKSFAPYDIQHPDVITCSILCRKPLHESKVFPHKIKDTGLLSRASVTRNLYFPQLARKCFMENKLENLTLPRFKVTASFDPEFRIFNSEAALHFVPQYQVMFIAQDNYIPTGNPHEIASVRINLTISIHVGIWLKPFQDLFDVFGHACLLKGILF
jgi:hypothetical protein